jgi:Holliday junction resolvase-like predicted endonuclease
LLHRRESSNVVHDYRFDVIAVNKFLKINHIQNAF